MRYLQISSVDTNRYKSGISMLLGKWATESVEDNIFDWGKYRFLKFLITSLLSY